MNKKNMSRYVLLLFVWLTMSAPGASWAENQRTYTNQEFGFSLRYPESWVISPATAPNLRFKVITPLSAPNAQCSVIVKRYPNAAQAKQEDIDQIFVVPPVAGELQEILSNGVQHLEVLSSGAGKLHTRPAHLAKLRFKTETSLGEADAYGRILMTATPGLTWTLSCSGQGETPAIAEKAFVFWGKEIDDLITSFRFQ